jgi:hypothetical protein
MAERAGVSRVYEEQRKIVFDFYEKNMLSPKLIAELSEELGAGILIHAGIKPFIKINHNGKNKLHLTSIFLLKFMVQ